MKNYLVAAIVLWAQAGFAQLTFDNSLPEKFELVKKHRFSGRYQVYVEQVDEGIQDAKPATNGFVLCVRSVCDTLNKNELLPIESKFNYLFEDRGSADTLDVFLCSVKLEGGLLKLSFGAPFEHQFMDFEIGKASVQSVFREDYKEPTVKLYQTDSLANIVLVPVVINKFVLSESPFENDHLIYGFCDITTQPYYFADHWTPPGSQLLKLKRYYTCYFRFRVSPK